MNLKFWKKKPAAQPAHEQRKHVRIKTIFSLDIKFIDKNTNSPLSDTLQCLTNDVSEGGLALTIAAPTKKIIDLINAPSTKLSILLHPPFTKNPIIAFGTVSWHKTVKDSSIPKIIVGISYSDIIKEEQKKLFSYAKYNRRKPFEIGFAIALLLAYGVFVSYNYTDSNFKNKNLMSSLKSMGSEKTTVENNLKTLKQKEKDLLEKTEQYEEKNQQLKNEMGKLAIGFTNKQTEEYVQGLQKDNDQLKQTLDAVQNEMNFLKKKLSLFEDNKFFLKAEGQDQAYPVAFNAPIEIIKLNNQNTLLGKTVQKTEDKIILSLADNTTIDLPLTDIRNINTIKILDATSLSKESTQETSTTKDMRIDFLRKVSYDSYLYFINETDPKTGLVKDTSSPQAPCNISSVGFALAGYCIAEKNGWIKHDDAYNAIIKILKTFEEKVETQHGFFYHFVDLSTGKRVWNSELSCFDTTVFICGALLAGEYFKNTEIEKIAKKLYNNVEWTWMANKTNLLCMGWKPEIGFLPYYWDTFNEGILSYILAIGSETYPLKPVSWETIERPVGKYNSTEIIYSETGSLYVYQMPLLWVNFKNLNDKGINYFDNAKKATSLNRQFCIDNQYNFKTYSPTSWGLTACSGPDGYKGYGAKPGAVIHDGTVAPSAVAGSMMLAPEICAPALQKMYETHGKSLYGFYGFKDAYNLDKNWFADVYLGINQGITLLAIQNYLDEFIWKNFMETSAVKNWIKKCGIKEQK